MRDALILMNPRNIEPCMRSYADLDIPRIRLVEMTEIQIADVFFDEALTLGFDWYWVVSDDAIVRQPALDAVRRLRDRGHPVVTGYSQRSHSEWIVNLTSEPLRGEHPTVSAYEFRHFSDVVSYPEDEVPTWFTGMSLTGMSAEMWERYPFDCFRNHGTGYASDFALSIRLGRDEVPIVAAREGFCYHWRNDWQHTRHTDDADPVFADPRVILEG